MLIGGRFDIAIGNKPAILMQAEQVDLEDKITFLKPTVDNGPNYFAFSKARNDADELVVHAVNKVTLRVAVRVRIKACFAGNGMPLSRNTTQSRARTASPEGPQHNRFWQGAVRREWHALSKERNTVQKRLCCG